MKDLQARTTIHASPADAFRFLSSVDNVPSYVPHVKSVRLEADDHLWGMLEVNGRQTEMDGYFRVDQMNRRIDWGSDGTPPYHGWLQVAGNPQGHTELVVRLSMELPDDREDTARQRLCDALGRVRSRIEEQVRGRTPGGERRVA